MKRKGPIQTVRDGSTSVPIYSTATRTGGTFVVVWYEGSDRKRKAFAKLQDAVDFARNRAKELARLGTASITLTGEELLAYRRPKAALATPDIPVDTAVVEYVEARRILGAHHWCPQCVKSSDSYRQRSRRRRWERSSKSS